MKPTKYNSYRHSTKRDKIYALHIDSHRQEYLTNPSQEELDQLFMRAAQLQCQFPKTVVRIVEAHLSGWNHFFKTPLI